MALMSYLRVNNSGINLAGLLSQCLRIRHDAFPPRAIAKPDPIELCREPIPLARPGELTSM